MTNPAAKIRLPDDIEDALRGTGLSWEARPGGKHIKLFLCGHRVGVVSYGSRSRDGFRGSLNLVKAIERKAKELTHRAQAAVKGE